MAAPDLPARTASTALVLQAPLARSALDKRARRAFKGHLAWRAPLEPRVQLAALAHKVCKASKAFRAVRGCKVYKAFKARQAQRDHEVRKVCKVYRDSQGLKVLKACREYKDSQVLKALKAYRV